MDTERNIKSSSTPRLNRTEQRLALYQRHVSDSSQAVELEAPVATTRSSQQQQQQQQQQNNTTAMARDPITCHVLNTLTGTPAANLPCTLTLLSGEATAGAPRTFQAITDSDGRIKTWSPTSTPSEAGTPTTTSNSTATATATATVPTLLSSLPSPDAKTNWSIRFDVGPWFEAQGIESFWPEVEVKFTVRGRGVEGVDGWRHYHVPVLLGPWSYSTYRGS